ncbi:MAG: hypothetical protein L0Y54_17480 [Sporichthyaceae bacterium]|nr:hypothetical protein [Sporichthyaceae bacterium]
MTKLRRRSLRLLLALLLGAPLAVVGPVAPAHAGACYDGATAWFANANATIVRIPSSGSYRTTWRCADINFTVRQFSDAYFQGLVRVCFVSAGYCNSWKYYNGADPNLDWMVIASNVKDGTTFRVEIDFYESSWGNHYGGLLAY